MQFGGRRSSLQRSRQPDRGPQRPSPAFRGVRTRQRMATPGALELLSSFSDMHMYWRSQETNNDCHG